MFYIFLSLSIAAHVIRDIYEILKNKKKIDTKNKFIFLFMVAVMFTLWASWFFMCQFDPYKINLMAVIKYAGFALFITGLVLFFAALFRLKTFENYKGKLITTGAFKFIRHPMYFSYILWIIGYSVFWGAVLSFFIGILFSVNIIYWQICEEKLLKQYYPEYTDYMKKTVF